MRTASTLSGEPTDAITRAPAIRAAWTAAPATPPDADGTSTVSPARRAATETTIDQAVETTHWAAAAVTTSSAERSGSTARAGTDTSSAYPPQRSVPNTTKRSHRSERHRPQAAQRPHAYCW